MEKKSAADGNVSKTNINQILVENFVNLQRVLTSMSAKFDSLANEISKLLHLFEESAKSFAEKNSENAFGLGGQNKEFLNKLDNLLDQNKTIARGITLMEEKLRERTYGRI